MPRPCLVSVSPAPFGPQLTPVPPWARLEAPLGSLSLPGKVVCCSPVIAMESFSPVPLSDTSLRAPFQLRSATGGPWKWCRELSFLTSTALHLNPSRIADAAQCRWFHWRKVIKLWQESLCTPAHRWFFCYHLVPVVGEALSALQVDPQSTLATQTQAFLDCVDGSTQCAGAKALFTSLQPLAEVDGSASAGSTEGETTSWWQPLPPPDLSNLPLNTVMANLSADARSYVVRFSGGPDRGDCLPWAIVVLIYYLHGHLVTVKEFRTAAAGLVEHGFPSQGAIDDVRRAFQRYDLPDDPVALLNDTVTSLSQASGLSKWESLPRAVSATEAESPGGYSFDLPGMFGILVYISVGLERGWISRSATPSLPIIPVGEMHSRELGEEVHPFQRIGHALQPGQRRAYLLGNGSHFVPIIIAHPTDKLVQKSQVDPIVPSPELVSPTGRPRPLLARPQTPGTTVVDQSATPLPPLVPHGLPIGATMRLATGEPSPSHLVVFDGACRNNGLRAAEAGAGFAVYTADFRMVVQGGAWLGSGAEVTNNQAEFTAFCLAIQALLDSSSASVSAPKPTVVVVGDSKLVIDAVAGRNNVVRPGLRDLTSTARSLASRINGYYFHTPRADNARADALANQAVDRKSSFIWRGDDWLRASREWSLHGRTQTISVTRPLRLRDGTVHPALLQPGPAPTASDPSLAPNPQQHSQPLLAHDVDWVVDQLNQEWSTVCRDSTADEMESTPPLAQLRAVLVKVLTVVTVHLPLHAAVNGALWTWARDQCTFTVPRNQGTPRAYSRVYIREGDTGFAAFWIEVILAVASAREHRIRHPPEYNTASGAVTPSRARGEGGLPFPNMTWRRSDSLTTPAPTAISPAPPGSAGGISGPRRPTTGSSVGEPGGGGGGRGPLHPNRSWVNPNLRGPHGKPLTSSGSPFSTPSPPRTSSSQQTPPITPHRAPRQSTGASGKPPPGGGGQQLFRTPSSLPGCRGGGPNIEWTPAPSSGRKRRSPTSRKGPLPYTEVISPNPYAPLGTTPIRDQGASATGTSLPKSTPRRAGIRSQPPAVHSPPHSQRTKPRSQLAATTQPVALPPIPHQSKLLLPGPEPFFFLPCSSASNPQSSTTY